MHHAPAERLGAGGAADVHAHAAFIGVEFDGLASGTVESPLSKAAREMLAHPKEEGEGSAAPLPELPPCDDHEWCADFSSSL